MLPFWKHGAIAAKLIAERERWVLWLPVALGAGIACYFGLGDEPPAWLGPSVLAGGVVVAGLVRRRLPWLVPAIALAAAALGFTLAAQRSAAVAAPVLQRPTGVIRVEGRVALIEPLENGQRVVLDRLALPPLKGESALPRRLRLHLRATDDVAPGERLVIAAVLMPPPPPAAPGAYDFPRQAWFNGLGAVGYAVGPPQPVAAPTEGGWRERLRLRWAEVRRSLTGRINQEIVAGGLPAGVGAVAAALITGERGPVAPEVLQAYRDAGLAHILVIAGMHMSMVAGLVFIAIRGGLAAIPWLVLRYSIKKWTAAGALLVTFGYLIISGAPVPTQRAFIMNGIVLLAVLLDRQAISLRSITWAAVAVLVLQPEALVGASFQMSFAAVYGLIAGYEALAPMLGRWHRAAAGTWLSVALLYVAGILLTTQIAGTATAFYTVFHFNRYATYSLLGNFLAVPVVGFWVMPAALLAFCLLPFGLDGWGWHLMGLGIMQVSRIALWVSSLPGATLNLPAVPIASLIVFTLGGFWLCLWRTPWRLFGLVGVAAGLLLWGLHRPPDILVGADGGLLAVRAADGRLGLSQLRGDKSVRESWLKQAGQGTEALLWDDIGAVGCDALGCVYRRAGHVVAMARRPEALEEDCRAAGVVIVPVPVRVACSSAGLLIDGFSLRRSGAHAIWLDEGGVRVRTVAEWQGARPWASYKK
jgi:competence protein ComEC